MRLRLSYFVAAVFCVGAFVGGCSKSQQTVATWKGDLIEETRINEEVVECEKTTVKDVDWYSSPGVLRVQLVEDCAVAYDLKRRFKQMEAVRCLTPQQTEELNLDTTATAIAMPLASALTFGIGAPVCVQQGLQTAELNETSMHNAVDQLKQGASEASANIYETFESETPLMVVKVVAREAGEVEEVLSSQTDQITRGAARIPLRLEMVGQPQDRIIAVTDETGWAVFSFADEPRDALALIPADIVVESNIEDEWVEQARTKLTRDRIDLIVKKTMADSMSLRGEPQLPPIAKVIPKLPDSEIRAGAECELSLAVENGGKGEFYRLVARTECAVDSLSGVEYEFGKLAPGETLTLSRRFRIPVTQPTGPMVVAFRWRELNGHQPEPLRVELWIRGLPQPRFSVRVEPIDDNSGNSQGNGDRQIQKGEQVDLLVEVRNEGDASAQDVVVKIEDVSNDAIHVEVGSEVLGEIAVNETKVARLTVLPERTLQANSLDVTFRVVDQGRGVEHREEVTFPLGSELAPDLEF